MTGSETKTYRAACLQFDVERGRIERNLQSARAGIRDAADQGVELIVLPELWTTSFFREATDELLQASAEAEDEIVRSTEELGVMVVSCAPESRDGHVYITARIFDRGELLGAYRKIHLFSPNGENEVMQAGDRPLIVDTRLGRVGVALCYDLRFPELTRYYFHHGVQVLCLPAQWPDTRVSHWRALILARAIENQCFVVACNRTGNEPGLLNDEAGFVFPGESQIVDPMGEVLAAAGNERSLARAEIALGRCVAMRDVNPIHADRRCDVYRDVWLPAWDGFEEAGRRPPEPPIIEPAEPNP